MAALLSIQSVSVETIQDVSTLSTATSLHVDPAKDMRTIKWVGPVKKGWFRQYAGVLLTLGAEVLFSLLILLVTTLQAHGFEAEHAYFWRNAGITILSIPFLVYFECKHKMNQENSTKTTSGLPGSVFDTIWPLNRSEKWITIAALLSPGILQSMLIIILRYSALEYLTVGDSFVIYYTSPVLVTILAHFLLGEKTGWVPVLSALLALCGVVFIAKPPLLTGKVSFDNRALVGTGLAVGSLICTVLVTIMTRKIRTVQFSLVLAIYGSIGMVMSLIMSQLWTGFPLPHRPTDALMLIGVAGLSLLGQMLRILALKFEEAGPVAIFQTCHVVFGSILKIFSGMQPSLFHVMGNSIICLAILVTVTRK